MKTPDPVKTVVVAVELMTKNLKLTREQWERLTEKVHEHLVKKQEMFLPDPWKD